MSDWVRVPLGEVTTHRKDSVKVDANTEYPMLGVRWYSQGVFHRETTTPKAATIYRASAGQFIYNRLFAWKGSFGLITDELDGSYVSNEFPVFDCDEQRLLPAYLNYFFAQPAIWEDIERISTGTTASRNRWNEGKFAAYLLSLPPISEQRRIVTVMSAVDAHIQALEAEVHTAHSFEQRMVSELLAGLPTTTKYGSVAMTRSGPSWGAANESKIPVEGALRVVKITNTKDDGSFDMADKTYVAGLPESTPTLNDASLVLIRTNGNRNRIGNVYRPTAEAIGCAVSAFQFISQATFTANRDFLYWALKDPAMQQQMSKAASGTTGLGNLAVRWLNAVDIPWSDDVAERSTVTVTADAIEGTVRGLTVELKTLRSLRTDLLSALLSQQITVDEAVDQFIEPAA